MNRDDVIRWAREAGFDTDLPGFRDGSAIALKLAALVAAAAKAEENEACAKVCEGVKGPQKSYGARVVKECAAAIRARRNT